MFFCLLCLEMKIKLSFMVSQPTAPNCYVLILSPCMFTLTNWYSITIRHAYGNSTPKLLLFIHTGAGQLEIQT